MHLVLVVLSGPRSEAVHTATELSHAALAAGHRISVFLAGDGVVHRERLAGLRDAGARVVACAADAAVRGADRPGVAGRGSFVDLGGMAADGDTVLVL